MTVMSAVISKKFVTKWPSIHLMHLFFSYLGVKKGAHEFLDVLHRLD